VKINEPILIQIKGLRQSSFQKHQEHCLEPNKKLSHEATIAKPKNEHFLPLKHVFFLSQQVTILYINMFESKTNKKKTSKSSMRYQIQKQTT
jgi:hypothetical protein